MADGINQVGVVDGDPRGIYALLITVENQARAINPHSRATSNRSPEKVIMYGIPEKVIMYGILPGWKKVFG